MLSFLRDQKFGDSNRDEERLGTPEDSSVQNPPDTAGGAPDNYKGGSKRNEGRSGTHEEGQEYLTVASQNKNVRRSTTLLAVLFAAGVLCLWFMIKKSTPQTATAMDAGTEEAQIEAAITRLTGVRSEMFSRMDEIVRKFYELSDVQQVQVDELVKNPFKHDTFLGDLEASNIEDWDFDTDTETMQLLSIMQSEQGNCCMIDDKILYEGDSIRGFKVSQIGNSFVKLKSENEARDQEHEIILKLLE
jgi:preprotein translocase subunit SecG